MPERIEESLHEKIARLDRRSFMQFWGVLVSLFTVLVWSVGAIFWVGSAYQRFESMDKHLEQIDGKLDIVNDVRVIHQRQDDNMKRIEVLELFVMKQQERGR